MTQLTDVNCSIKIINDLTGKVVPDGEDIPAPGKAIVRYVVANDSHKPAGPLFVVGALHRNGVKIQPGGQSNVIPAQQITLQPNQIWKQEYAVTESDYGVVQYVAKILGDVGGFVNEEDEANNQAKRSFGFYRPPA